MLVSVLQDGASQKGPRTVGPWCWEAEDGMGRKKGEHELSKGGNAKKTLARSVNLTGARALPTG